MVTNQSPSVLIFSRQNDCKVILKQSLANCKLDVKDI
jgi:hypothetical protein